MNIRYLTTTILLLSMVTVVFAVTKDKQSSTKAENGARPVLVNSIVAIVNNDVITQAQLNKQIKLLTMQLKAQNITLPSEKELVRQVLNKIINDKIQLQLAKKNNITATSQQVTKHLSRIATNNKKTVNQIYQQAEGQGISRQALRSQIKNQIIIEKFQQQVMARRINVSDQQITNFIHQMKNTSQQAKKEYHLKDILISLPAAPSANEVQQARDRAKVLVQKLQQGADFTQIALAQSDSQSTLQNHGDLGWRSLAELPDVFSQQVKTMKQGQVAGPIRTANGFHIIKVAGIRGMNLPTHQIEQADLAQIILKSSAQRSPAETLKLARKIHSYLNNGKDFLRVIQEYSREIDDKNSGFIGWKNFSDYPQNVIQAIKKLKSGEVSEPIMAGDDYYIIKVIGKRQLVDVTKAQRIEIINKLYRKQMLEGLQSWISELRAQAYIKIMLNQKAMSGNHRQSID